MTGFLALAAFGGLMSRLTPDADLWTAVFPALACYGVFIMIVMPTTAMQTFTGLTGDPAVFAHAQQVKNMLAQIGQALGIMLATIGQQWFTSEHYDRLRGGIVAGNANFESAMARLTDYFSAVAGPAQARELAMEQIAQMVSRQSVLLASLDHFHVVMAVALIAAVVSLTQRVFR
ncbi:hypothetical protein D9M68_739120 [compost metagenome]